MSREKFLAKIGIDPASNDPTLPYNNYFRILAIDETKSDGDVERLASDKNYRLDRHRTVGKLAFHDRSESGKIQRKLKEAEKNLSQRSSLQQHRQELWDTRFKLLDAEAAKLKGMGVARNAAESGLKQLATNVGFSASDQNKAVAQAIKKNDPWSAGPNGGGPRIQLLNVPGIVSGIAACAVTGAVFVNVWVSVIAAAVGVGICGLLFWRNRSWEEPLFGLVAAKPRQPARGMLGCMLGLVVASIIMLQTKPDPNPHPDDDGGSVQSSGEGTSPSRPHQPLREIALSAPAPPEGTPVGHAFLATPSLVEFAESSDDQANPLFATDGKIGTRWISKQGFTLKFDEPHPLDGVVILNGTATAHDGATGQDGTPQNVQLKFKNGSSRKLVISNSTLWQFHPFDQVESQSVEVVVTSTDGDGAHAGIAEMWFCYNGGSSASTSDWNGTWSTEGGDLVFRQDGNWVQVSYTNSRGDEGRIVGRATEDMVMGTWAVAPSFSPPNNAGDIQLRIRGKNTYTAKWKNGSSGEWIADGFWDGKR